jgi:hypothetical protein
LRVIGNQRPRHDEPLEYFELRVSRHTDAP